MQIRPIDLASRFPAINNGLIKFDLIQFLRIYRAPSRRQQSARVSLWVVCVLAGSRAPATEKMAVDRQQ